MMIQTADLAIANPTSEELVAHDSGSMGGGPAQSSLGSSDGDRSVEDSTQLAKENGGKEEREQSYLGDGKGAIQDVTRPPVQGQECIGARGQVRLDGRGQGHDPGQDPTTRARWRRHAEG